MIRISREILMYLLSRKIAMYVVYVLIASTWQEQPWYPELLRFFSKQLTYQISWTKYLLKSPLDQAHPLVQNKTLTLALWIIAGDDYVMHAFLSKFPHLSQVRERKTPYEITCGRGRNGLADVLDRKSNSVSYKQCYKPFSRLFF